MSWGTVMSCDRGRESYFQLKQRGATNLAVAVEEAVVGQCVQAGARRPHVSWPRRLVRVPRGRRVCGGLQGQQGTYGEHGAEHCNDYQGGRAASGVVSPVGLSLIDGWAGQ